VKRRKRKREEAVTTDSLPHTTPFKSSTTTARSCRLRLHSLSEYSSKQENEKKKKAKDRSEQESNTRLVKMREKAVGHRFLILTTGEATGSGDSHARDER
jgi:hypothetical protein